MSMAKKTYREKTLSKLIKKTQIKHCYSHFEIDCSKEERTWYLAPKDQVTVRLSDEITGADFRIGFTLGDTARMDGIYYSGFFQKVDINIQYGRTHCSFENIEELSTTLANCLKINQIARELSENDIDKITLEEAKEYLKKIKDICKPEQPIE